MKTSVFAIRACGTRYSRGVISLSGESLCNANTQFAVDRNSKRAVSEEQGEARWGAGASMGWIVGNCQPNGASEAGIDGAVAAKRAGFGFGTISR